MTEEAKVEVSKEMDEFISYVEKLSVLDLSKLVKALENRLGVTAAVPMAAAAPAAGAAAPAAEEKTAFNVILSAFAADKKIAIIKEVRAITGLGLKEAKDLVEGAPKPVKEGATKEEAEKMKAQLVAAGATVELK